jgi:carnitine O-octanoyltransferase
MVSAEVCAFALKAVAKREWNKVRQVGPPPLVQEIKLIVEEEIGLAASELKLSILSRADDIDFHLCEFQKFGKSRIKEMKVHPDTFVQVALQVAAFKTHHR